MYRLGLIGLLVKDIELTIEFYTKVFGFRVIQDTSTNPKGDSRAFIKSGDTISSGGKELWLDASLTAVPFYEAEGWEHVEHRMHGILECVRMIKRMAPEAEPSVACRGACADNQD